MPKDRYYFTHDDESIVVRKMYEKLLSDFKILRKVREIDHIQTTVDMGSKVSNLTDASKLILRKNVKRSIDHAHLHGMY
jgi:hypothetical protein